MDSASEATLSPTDERISVSLSVNLNHVLPAELLLYLFHHVRDLFNVPPGSPIPRGIKVYAWIPVVTHVCRYWRSLALPCQSLWNVITVKRSVNNQCVEAMIRRSGTWPLHVTLAPVGMGTELIQPILQEMHRIEELVITSPLRRLLSQKIRPLLALPAPLLRALYLSTERTSEDSRLIDHPRALFNASLPKLRLLVLNDPTNSFLPSHARPSLREFRCTLQVHHGQPTELIPHHTALSALRLMPWLQKLSIDIDAPAFDGPVEESSSQHYATLRHLQEAHIDAPIQTCIFLLQHMHTSSLAHLDVKCSSISNADILRTLISVMNDKVTRQLSSLVFQFNEFDLVTQCYDSESSIVQIHNNSTKPKPNIDLFLPIYHMRFDHYFPVQLNNLQLSFIHTMFFRCMSYFHEVFTLVPRLISMALRETPLLRHLGIEGYPSKNIVELFSTSPQTLFEVSESQDPDDTSEIFLPNLESLTFVACSLHWSDDGELFARFIEGLNMRKRRNKGLSKLVLVDCYDYGSVELEALDAVVTEILDM
ncbi:hypothetical protein C8Q75DRAFT_283681 [Abortiporus biennis]|nr:hypothetical protein C8Q75DRAFT_283681 [Abortiporus biennis]